jgi:hypothetical protein
MSEIDKHIPDLYNDVCQIIDGTRNRLAVTVNAELCWLNWRIGKRIKEDVLYNKRAEYGKEIVKQLAEKLTLQYGKGWSDRKLLHCIRSAYIFTEDEIGYAVRIQLTWTHLYTQLPDKKTLSNKLHKAILIAQENYQAKK